MLLLFDKCAGFNMGYQGLDSLPGLAASTKARQLWYCHASAAQHMQWLHHALAPYSHELTNIDLVLRHTWMHYGGNQNCMSIPHNCCSQAQC